MSPLTESEFLIGRKPSKQRMSADQVIRSSQAAGAAFAGSPSPVIHGSLAPDLSEQITVPGQAPAAFRGVVFALGFEAAAVAAVFAVWEVWKMLR